jgi:hypothetical protein
VDSGQAVNPDGIRNQIEGGILQSASWTLYKSVTFDLPLFGSDGPASRVEAKIKSDVGWHQAEFVAPDRNLPSSADSVSALVTARSAIKRSTLRRAAHLLRHGHNSPTTTI